MKMRIAIDRNKCIRCGHCAMVCPSAVLLQEKTGEDIKIENTNACIECGHCVDVCPKEAIEHEAFPRGSVHEIDRSALPSPDSLMELIRSRRSNRTFTDYEIPSDVLSKIIEAAKYAPTAENTRQVEIKIINGKTELQAVEDAVMDFFMGLVNKLTLPFIKQIAKVVVPDTYARLPELFRMDKEHKDGKRPASVNAKVILVFHAPKGYDFGYQDCNLAYQNASLMAESLGVSQVYLGFVQTAMQMIGTRKAARVLGIEKDHKAFAIMALGLPSIKYIRCTERM